MLYRMPCLQFGDNVNRVPGYEIDSWGTTTVAPVHQKLVDSADKLWGLVFSYESPTFFTAAETVPGQNGAVINSWYSPIGGGPPDGPNSLTLMPFVDGQFSQVSDFVDFSEPATTANSINTDNIAQPSVTATVKLELPGKIDVSMQSTSQSIIITTSTATPVFEKIFVIYGGNSPAGNALTVPKGQSCLALAVYKSEISTSTTEHSTIQKGSIPWWEWRMIYAEIVKGIATRGTGEILEYVSPRMMAELGPDVLRTAIVDIGKRMEQLDVIKAMITDLAEKTGR